MSEKQGDSPRSYGAFFLNPHIVCEKCLEIHAEICAVCRLNCNDN
nr:MAG TPA: hypothetical protein [Caudoviricetes sp.]